MNDEERTWDWHENQGVVWAAGVAAVLLIALLVFAVVQTATGSSDTHATTIPPTSSAASTKTTVKSGSSTSYAVPSVQTSEPAVAPIAPPIAPNDEPTQGIPPLFDPSTTIYNPYAPSTTAPAAGHV